jgi:uncharacterized protein YneR
MPCLTQLDALALDYHKEKHCKMAPELRLYCELGPESSEAVSFSKSVTVCPSNIAVGWRSDNFNFCQVL